MAQWLGQFSGHTHETKLKDAEQSLATAIKSLPLHPGQPTQNAYKLAERVLTLRLKALSARSSALTERQMLKVSAEEATQIGKLRRKEQQLLKAGVEGILQEFGFC
jgi:hypothetical protein